MINDKYNVKFIIINLLTIHYLQIAMNNPVKKDWLRLPDLILSDIMKVIALESITTLRICTKVCTSWEEEIMSNPSLLQIARTNRQLLVLESSPPTLRFPTQSG